MIHNDYGQLARLLEVARREEQRRLGELESLDERRYAGDGISLENVLLARDRWRTAHQEAVEIQRAMMRAANATQVQA